MGTSLEQRGTAERAAGPGTDRGDFAVPVVLFWAGCAGITAAIYWICLRFLYPGYFAPLSPFHVDFYVYAAAREQSLRTLLLRYPRPVTYLGLKVLTTLGGIKGLMAGGIAISLVGVLLTLELARRMLRIRTPWLAASYAAYAVLLFAHPQFYVEHRHDLPAELSWLFLAVSLLAWMAWVERRPRRIAMLGIAVTFAVLFAFAKETYFVSALILVLAMAITDAVERRLHLRFLAFLCLIEVVSFAWTSHVNSPFVNLNADAASTYHISLAPFSLGQTFGFYLANLTNPWILGVVALSLLAAWNRRSRFILEIAFVLAGLAAFTTLAVLPNHKFEEYAWAAVPLFLAPMLTSCERGTLVRVRPQAAVFIALFFLTIAGPASYRTYYQTDAAKWWVAQDRRSAAVLSSLPRLQGLARPARVLISGIEDPQLPWQVGDFVQREFGEGIRWTIVLPAEVSYRRPSPLVTFARPADLHLSDFDYIATYRVDGTLTDVRAVTSIPVNADPAEVLLPELADAVAESRRAPKDYKPVLHCAEICLTWGFLSEAGQFLDQANVPDACDPTFQQLSFDVRTRLQQSAATGTLKGQLIAKPPDGIRQDAGGVGVTEVSWTAPPGARTEVRVDSPDGTLFAKGGDSGQATTQKWAREGTRFFLLDVTNGKPGTSENILAVLTLGKDFSGATEAIGTQMGKAEITANPSHITPPDHSGLGSTELRWRAPQGTAVEIHVCSPRGALLASGGDRGKAATEKWVTNGMQFFLQDVTGGKPLTSENTLAVSRVEVSP
jgi:hypothetical protein